MLESIVSSRVRRTLFEYILTHPNNRFYLRGLAKNLDLSISPLRRELKRLEKSGLLHSEQEANILFYTVKTDSTLFHQLNLAAAQPAVLPSVPNQPSELQPSFEASQSVNTVVSSAVNFHEVTASPADLVSWQQVLKGPIGLATGVVGMLLAFIISGLIYMSVSSQTSTSDTAKGYKIQEKETVVTVIASPTPSSAGVMQGERWKIVPGGFGGFSPAVSTDVL